ncbi:MAG: glucosamine-6-phosphate deaminase [Alphaproteobacteria bacterium]|nr:glucosamine-6-phosphate deaminase [Alphaproteobacteria bacterium]
MRVIIKENSDNVSKWAADYVAYRINHFKPTKGRPFVLGLPTGSTPLGMYAELIKLYKAGKLSFENVVTFNMDEYIGLDSTHPQSYHYFMQENFFKYINIKPQNIHILNGMTKDFAKECREYERAMRNVGGVHLFIGGVGVDGHIAFNEPFSSLESRTRVKTLTESTIKANSRFFDNDLSKVPTMALTVGVGTIMDAEEVMIIATGKNKATALKHGIEGALSHVWTISALQKHRHGIIVCDKEAVSELSAETVDYFMDIEKNNY